MLILLLSNMYFDLTTNCIYVQIDISLFAGMITVYVVIHVLVLCNCEYVFIVLYPLQVKFGEFCSLTTFSSVPTLYESVFATFSFKYSILLKCLELLLTHSVM